MLDGELAPPALLDLALRALPRETDELNVEEILGQLRTIYWRFLSASQRLALAPRVERVLRDGLSLARTQSLKGAYFSAFRNTSLTPSAIAWLTSVWEERVKVPGLTLAEPDYIAIARDLALRSSFALQRAKRDGRASDRVAAD